MDHVKPPRALSAKEKRSNKKSSLSDSQKSSTASNLAGSRRLKPISESTVRTTNGSTKATNGTVGWMKGGKYGITGSVYRPAKRKTKTKPKGSNAMGKKKLFQSAAIRVWASVAVQRRSSLQRNQVEEVSDSEEDNYYVIPRSLLRKLSLLKVSGGQDGRKRLSITMLNKSNDGEEAGEINDDQGPNRDIDIQGAEEAKNRRRYPSLGSLVGLMVFRELQNKKYKADEKAKQTKPKRKANNTVQWDSTVEEQQRQGGNINHTVDSALPERFSSSLSREGQFATFRCYEDKVVAHLSRKDPQAGLHLNRPRSPPRRLRQTLVTAGDLREAIDLYDDLQDQEEGPVSRRTRERSRKELPSTTAAYKKLGGIWSRQHGNKPVGSLRK